MCPAQSNAQDSSQAELASRRIRGVIFQRLDASARSGVKLLEYSIEQTAFERIFAVKSSHIVPAQEILLSDPEESSEDEEQGEEKTEDETTREKLVGVQQQVQLTSFAEVQDFAAFHELTLPGIERDGACCNSKVLRRSGEVVLLIPPLIATWHMTAEGTSKTIVSFSWAVLNCAGKVMAMMQPVWAQHCMLYACMPNKIRFPDSSKVCFGSSQPRDPEAYHPGLQMIDADPRLALSKQVAEHVRYLLADRGLAAGVTPLLHPDLHKQRVLYFGLSRLYWSAGRPGECNPSWLAQYHPESPEAQPLADPNALVISPPQSHAHQQHPRAKRRRDS